MTSLHHRFTAAPSEDGWIAHDGGHCPLPWAEQVYIRFADGIESDRPYAAGWWTQYWRPGMERHGVKRNHIVAYRFADPLSLPKRLDRIAAKRRAA